MYVCTNACGQTARRHTDADTGTDTDTRIRMLAHKCTITRTHEHASTQAHMRTCVQTSTSIAMQACPSESQVNVLAHVARM
eukprot:4160610-Alexandrium_andersonii.AAC.2